jgi:Ig-like domain from next to BRCA1 gene
MNNKTLSITAIMAVLFIFTAACGLSALGSPSANTPGDATAVIQTVNAQLTSISFDEVVVKLTQMAPGAATQTSVPANTLAPSSTPLDPTETDVPYVPPATSTPAPPTPTSTPVPCNSMKFIKDVNIPDGSTFDAREGFTKTWRLQNNGSCTWNTDYDLVFVDGDAMGAPDTVNLEQNVDPGETVDVSVNFVAPGSKGDYTSNWKLRSDNGIVFGWGSGATKPFWAEIEVNKLAPTLDPDEPVDFYASYCSATWTSGTITLPCPGSGYDFYNGSITRTNKPKIEKKYQDDQNTIVTIPSHGTNGSISGKYPYVDVQDGDTFKARIGCMTGSTHCDVLFELKYKEKGGSTHSLGSWTEVYDGNTQTIAVDLSPLAGKTVQYILSVQDNGDSNDDTAFWMVPKIYR